MIGCRSDTYRCHKLMDTHQLPALQKTARATRNTITPSINYKTAMVCREELSRYKLRRRTTNIGIRKQISFHTNIDSYFVGKDMIFLYKKQKKIEKNALFLSIFFNKFILNQNLYPDTKFNTPLKPIPASAPT